ncbi:MAG: hypothetical protein LBK95_17840 [Bifidobacteriaceae bacterium]|nr:hypothetical protein [Bifidobacteriaceae bacterium]
MRFRVATERAARLPRASVPAWAAIYPIKWAVLGLALLEIPAILLHERSVTAFGDAPSGQRASFAILAAILAGVVAAAGCTEMMPPLPRPGRRVVGRGATAAILTVAALVITTAPELVLEGPRADVSPMIRNVALTFALTLFVVVTPLRSLAWLPTLALFSAETLFRPWFHATPVLRQIIVVNPQTSPDDLALAGTVWFLAVGVFAWRGCGPRTRPRRVGPEGPPPGTLQKAQSSSSVGTMRPIT